jgi:hypothetical protein
MEILLSGERLCPPKAQQCQPWSQHQHEIARAFSYWKQKLVMANQKFFHREHLDQLCW